MWFYSIVESCEAALLLALFEWGLGNLLFYCDTSSFFGFVGLLCLVLFLCFLSSLCHLCDKIISRSRLGLLWCLLLWFLLLWLLSNYLFFLLWYRLFLFVFLSSWLFRGWSGSLGLCFFLFRTTFILFHRCGKIIFWLFFRSGFCFFGSGWSSGLSDSFLFFCGTCVSFLSWGIWSNDFILFLWNCSEVKTHLFWLLGGSFFSTSCWSNNLNFSWIRRWELWINRDLWCVFLCGSFIIGFDLLKFFIFTTAETINLLRASLSSHLLFLHENGLLILMMDEKWKLIASNWSDDVGWEKMAEWGSGKLRR